MKNNFTNNSNECTFDEFQKIEPKTDLFLFSLMAFAAQKGYPLALAQTNE
jgi:hypothetical protein